MFLTFLLIILSVFMVIVILMQRANTNAGMGAAFGGSVAESAFGADTANVLTKLTRWMAIGFFGLALTLYLLYMAEQGNRLSAQDEGLLPTFIEEAADNTGVIDELPVEGVAPLINAGEDTPAGESAPAQDVGEGTFAPPAEQAAPGEATETPADDAAER